MPRFAAAAAALALLLPPLAPAAVLAQQAPAAAGEAAPDPARAARDAFEALLLPDVLDVMVREGVTYGETVAASVFGPLPVPAAWTELVASIYDRGKMEERLLASMAETLSPEDAAATAAFFRAEPGRSVAALELATREAMLDDDVEQAAREEAAVALAEDSPRLALLRRYAEVAGLIDSNVASAMNANYAYVMGLLDGGALGQDMTEADVLADVWSQEAQIRADTTEWVYSFLLRAYAPLSDGDIEALIAFTESAPGRALTRSLNVGFDGLFADISRALGLASAHYMTTEQL